jgi:carbon storage regulator
MEETAMLVLARRVEEALVLDNGRIRISVLEVTGGRVKLGIEAPATVAVRREEVGNHVPRCFRPAEPNCLAAMP